MYTPVFGFSLLFLIQTHSLRGRNSGYRGRRNPLIYISMPFYIGSTSLPQDTSISQIHLQGERRNASRGAWTSTPQTLATTQLSETGKAFYTVHTHTCTHTHTRTQTHTCTDKRTHTYFVSNVTLTFIYLQFLYFSSFKNKLKKDKFTPEPNNNK